MDHSHHHMAEAATPESAMAMCSMNMLFTWKTENLCIVFRWWHVRSAVGLFLSLAAVVAFSAGYEALREAVRRYERLQSRRTEALPRKTQDALARRAHIVKAVLYGIQNFYAFMIMLIFMTYNGWVMLAVSFGASLGYLLFGGETTITKETACH